MRAFPSTTRASLENAEMLSCVRAFASERSVRLTVFAFSCGPRLATVVSTSRCEYQTSRFLIRANRAIDVRYSSTACRTA
jgi:hypothetical protein